MAERNVSQSHFKVVSRNSLLSFFSLITILFMMSWFFILRSTRPEDNPSSIDRSSLPDSNQFSTLNTDSPLGNRAILGDSQDLEPKKIHVTKKPLPNDNDDTNDFGKCSSKPRTSGKKNVLKIFMYDLPSEFHFGLLDWKEEGNNGVWPDIRTKLPHYPGGLNVQHSIEYWLTLDLLASEQLPESSDSRTAIRVHNSSEADVILVPFFSSLSYNRFSRTDPHEKRSNNKALQEKLVKFVMEQMEWKRSGGRDHVILAHHPNSMLDARSKLWPATFILSDFGRYPPNIANVEKDVIAPYKHVVECYENDSSSFGSRTTLLYFQGAIYRKDGGHVRQELFYLLKEEKDVHFSFGSAQKGGVKDAAAGMRSSKFCLNIAGDTPSSNRLFDAIASHCVPVIISDEIELPYEDVLDYTEFCIFVRTRDALKKRFLIDFIRSISEDEWSRMWKRLKEVEKFYEFQFPSKEDDAVQMIWQAVARKASLMRLKTNKSRRFFRSVYGSNLGNVRVNSMSTPKNFW
ncbi:hypothetical protein PIB30_025723 [Stylosanthes scabra]|uniref:Exostosin GT47 domain-containing protein n=1 Tax=Stylosanthes scabra TaxID=79078 RepID=A0ABU6Z6W7_9FABA|nr:hypothetical protein [Stylosanthes scabra]